MSMCRRSNPGLRQFLGTHCWLHQRQHVANYIQITFSQGLVTCSEFSRRPSAIVGQSSATLCDSTFCATTELDASFFSIIQECSASASASASCLCCVHSSAVVDPASWPAGPGCTLLCCLPVKLAMSGLSTAAIIFSSSFFTSQRSPELLLLELNLGQ
jgi:hypothetical protein